MFQENHRSCLLEINDFDMSLTYSSNLSYPVPHPKSDSEQDDIADQIDDATQSLNIFRSSLINKPELLEAVDRLISFLFDLQAAKFRDSNEDLLEPLREMMFWFSTKFIPILNDDPLVMVLMSYLHAVALIVEPVAHKKEAMFRSLNIAPIEAFYEEFCVKVQWSNLENQAVYEAALSFMSFPLHAVAKFKVRLCSLLGNGILLDLLESNPISFEDAKNDSSYMAISTLKVLKNFPVGLWQNSLKNGKCR